jgi:hypothetical protein
VYIATAHKGHGGGKKKEQRGRVEDVPPNKVTRDRRLPQVCLNFVFCPPVIIS